MKLATITIYGVNWSCGSCETKRRDDDRYEGSIAKPSICIGQRLDADFPWYCQPIWEMMISVAMVLLFLFFSFFLRTSEPFCQLSQGSLRHSLTNSNKQHTCVTGTNRVYAHTPDHNYTKCHGTCLSIHFYQVVAYGECDRIFFQHSNFFYFHKQGNQ